MVQHAPGGQSDKPGGSSALDRENDRVDDMMKKGQDGEAGRKAKESQSGINNPTQVEQDNRIDKARAEAEAAGGGPGKPESGLNQDG